MLRLGSRGLNQPARGVGPGRRALGVALALAAFLTASAWGQTAAPPAAPEVVQVPLPLPAAVVETIPPSPGPAYVWIPGHHAWRSHHKAYVWLPGYYTVPVAPGYVWVPGYWAVAPGGGYIWVEGHWRLR
jgi:hypothetical protein